MSSLQCNEVRDCKDSRSDVSTPARIDDKLTATNVSPSQSFIVREWHMLWLQMQCGLAQNNPLVVHPRALAHMNMTAVFIGGMPSEAHFP